MSGAMRPLALVGLCVLAHLGLLAIKLLTDAELSWWLVVAPLAVPSAGLGLLVVGGVLLIGYLEQREEQRRGER